VTKPDRRSRNHRRSLLCALLVPSLVACGEKTPNDETRVVRAELALLEAPPSATVTDQRVELGEMDAFGTVTFAVADTDSGQRALDSMLRTAGWGPVSPAGNADGTIWQYYKRDLRASVRLDAPEQHSGRRFIVELIAPLHNGPGPSPTEGLGTATPEGKAGP
jgi:hypothetical protein